MESDKRAYLEIYKVCFTRDYAEKSLLNWKALFEKYENLYGPILVQTYETLGEVTWSWVENDPFEYPLGTTRWSTNYRPAFVVIAKCNELYSTAIANELVGESPFARIIELSNLKAYESRCQELHKEMLTNLEMLEKRRAA